ncbi:FecR domain-containing protein [Flexithrix dorotheae]|uniref:FecR domain-containing protein n=1 Tax=Flexithrix dorotheae TaxID=70993 RepID=UPI00037292B6|nr:FecR domain-containing protein [Flexithrix dorotheae]
MEEKFERLALRFFNKEATKEEIDSLKKLINENEFFKREFETLKITWEKEIFPQQKFDLARGRKILNQKIDESPTTKTRQLHTTTLNRRQVFAFAASVSVVLIFLSGLFLNRNFFQFNNSPIVQMVEKFVPAGKKQTIRLKDGTMVKLNAETKLMFPKNFKSTERVVHLEGEAFFEVARDTSRPFKIISGELETQVLGTSFNISAYPENKEIKVSVATGKVEVKNKNNKVHLIPGEQVIFSKQDASLIEKPFNYKQEFSWKDSTLFFEDTPMSLVAKSMERWYGISIKFENQEILDCQLTGEFKNESLINVLESIKYTNDITYRIVNETIFLDGKGCD